MYRELTLALSLYCFLLLCTLVFWSSFMKECDSKQSQKKVSRFVFSEMAGNLPSVSSPLKHITNILEKELHSVIVVRSEYLLHNLLAMFMDSNVTITQTCLYNFDPLKPHFYRVKVEFTGVYIIFLISAQKHRLRVLIRTALANIDCGYLLEPPCRGKATIYVFSRKVKNLSFLSENFQVLVVKFSIYLKRRGTTLHTPSCPWLSDIC